MLRAASSAIGQFQYDRARGSFRGWLFTTTRHALHRFQSARRRQPQAGNPDFERLSEEPCGAEYDDRQREWDRKFDRRHFDRASEQVRGEFQQSTWEAFWRTAVKQASPQAVAASLNMSVGAAYLAKSRVLARLRSVVEEVQNE